MPVAYETHAAAMAAHSDPAPVDFWHLDARNLPVAILALTMVLVPALGVPSVLLLQDTLKSALLVFGVLTAAALFFWQQRDRTAPLLWHGVVVLPLALMAYASVSMAWSHTYLAASETVRWFVLALLLFLGLNTLTRENFPTLARGIHLGAVIASVWTVLQFWFDLRLFPQFAVPASTFVNRNFFAEYAVCALPFSVFVLATMGASHWRVWTAFSLALNLVAILMAGTRSALIALALLAVVLPLMLARHRQQFSCFGWHAGQRALIALVLAAGVLGMSMVPTSNPRVLQQDSGSTALQRSFLRATSIAAPKEYSAGTFSVRTAMWKATLRMLLAHPLSGVGAGAWEVQVPLYQDADTTVETDYHAHNEFLQLLSEYGAVVGGLFIAFLLAYLLRTTQTTWQMQVPDQKEAALRITALASLLALLTVSNAGFPLHLAACSALLALCLATLAASDARLGPQEPLLARPLPWRASRSS